MISPFNFPPFFSYFILILIFDFILLLWTLRHFLIFSKILNFQTLKPFRDTSKFSNFDILKNFKFFKFSNPNTFPKHFKFQIFKFTKIIKPHIYIPNIKSHLLCCSKFNLTRVHTICSTNNRALQKVYLQVGLSIQILILHFFWQIILLQNFNWLFFIINSLFQKYEPG